MVVERVNENEDIVEELQTLKHACIRFKQVYAAEVARQQERINMLYSCA
jgi:hypothetical protein